MYNVVPREATFPAIAFVICLFGTTFAQQKQETLFIATCSLFIVLPP